MKHSSKYYSRWWRSWWRAGSGLASTISLAPVQWRPAASLEHHLAQIEAYGRDGLPPLTPSPSPAMEEFTFGSPAMEPTMDEGEKVIQYRVSNVSTTWRPSLTPYLVTHVSLLVRTINLDTTVLVGAVIIYFRYSIIIVSVGWMTVLLVCCVAILVIIAIVITTVYIISYRQRQKKKHNFGIKKFKSSVRLDNIMDKNANGVSL